MPRSTKSPAPRLEVVIDHDLPPRDYLTPLVRLLRRMRDDQATANRPRVEQGTLKIALGGQPNEAKSDL